MNEREIFSQALQKSDPEERSAFLDEVCGQETPQRERIELLLNELPNLSDYLEQPAIDAVATELISGDEEPQSPSSGDTLPDMEAQALEFLSLSENPEAIGQLGHYEILEVIGRGGMGIVLRGVDPKLNRVVAIKVLSPEIASIPSAHKRFLREAKAAAAVSHDHIVTIYAVEENPIPHLVMEYIDGKSLQQRINEEGQLEVKEVLRIARQIAAGLAAAHEQGLTHRDIKPSNILLQNGIQRVQITDFGLARATADADITRTGEIAGTPQYMSPEQAKSEPVEPRSDLFSLGSVMYAMCCGHSPFRADTPYASIKRVCEDEPRSLRENNPEIPTWLEAIVFKLLQKNPANRFQTAEEVTELLGKHLSHLKDPGSTPFPGTLLVSKPPRRKLAHPRMLAAVAVMLLAVVALGFTEAAGVTHFTGTVIRLGTGEGTLVIEVDDPTVQVSLDGEDLSISGAGLQELKLRPGQYQLQATKDGQPIEQKLVSISRGDREVVRVSLDSIPSKSLETTERWQQTEEYQSWAKESRLSIASASQFAAETKILNTAHQLAEEGKWLESLAAFEKWKRLPVEERNLSKNPKLFEYLLYLKTGNNTKFHLELTHQFPRSFPETTVGISNVSVNVILSQISRQPVEPPAELIERLSEFRKTLTIGSPPRTLPTGKWHDNISALVLRCWEYRQGNFQRALEFPTWNDEWYPHYHAVDLFVQSMAYAQLKDADNAKKCYEEAIHVQELNTPPRGAKVYDEVRFKPLWAGWVIYDIARTQAEHVLIERGVIPTTQ